MWVSSSSSSSEVIDARISAYIHSTWSPFPPSLPPSSDRDHASPCVCRYTARFTKMTDRLCLIGKKRRRREMEREGGRVDDQAISSHG